MIEGDMQILLATRNKDKFIIVKSMIESIVPDSYLISIDDANLKGDVVEVGTIQDRARQKARYFIDKLEEAGREDFDAVLGIDDGLSIGGNQASPNSKELTDKILRGEWPVGTSVDIVRAYALIRRGEQPRIEVTRVPFVFSGNVQGQSRREGSYPLSGVVSIPGDARTVSELPKAEEDAYNLTHSAPALEHLFS